MGGKFRLRKYILPIILKDRKEGQWYVEPFCGGCNTLSEVEGPRIGADLHPYLINLWQHVAKGWLPPEKLSEDEYNELKARAKQGDVDDPLIGYAGFVMSFGAKWFGGYARDNPKIRDFAGEGYNSALRQFPKLKDVPFFELGYNELLIPNSSIIYCDPPYENTTGYKTGSFNHNGFWDWCREKSSQGHKVFISEYNAPDDFVCIWEKQRKPDLGLGKVSPVVEKLFVHRWQTSS